MIILLSVLVQQSEIYNMHLFNTTLALWTVYVNNCLVYMHKSKEFLTKESYENTQKKLSQKLCICRNYQF